MSTTPLRRIGSQMAATAVGVVITAVVLSGGLAFAQEAPVEAGAGVAEAVAAPNSVNSAAIIDSAVTSADIAPSAVASSDILNATIGRGDVKAGVLTRWAKVDAGVTTTLLDGKGASSASRASIGVYRVTFATSIVGCGWTATLNDNDAEAVSPGEIAIERASSSNSFDLFVRTFNSAGAGADTAENEGFTVTVNC